MNEKEKETKEKRQSHTKCVQRGGCFDAQRIVGSGAWWRTHHWWLGCHGLEKFKILELLYSPFWGANDRSWFAALFLQLTGSI